MAVPVDPDVGAGVPDHLARKLDDGGGAVGRGMADGVGHANALGAGADGALVECAWVSGSARVVSSVTYITSRPSRTANVTRLFGAPQQEVERPAFRELANRRRADEFSAFSIARPVRWAILRDRANVARWSCVRHNWPAP